MPLATAKQTFQISCCSVYTRDCHRGNCGVARRDYVRSGRSSIWYPSEQKRDGAQGRAGHKAMEGGVVAMTNPGKELVPLRASLLPFEQLPNLPKPIVPEIDLGITREHVLAIE